jgi:hypothetical protein
MGRSMNKLFLEMIFCIDLPAALHFIPSYFQLHLRSTWSAVLRKILMYLCSCHLASVVPIFVLCTVYLIG